MFTNPGGKIKSYAKVIFWIGVVLSVIVGVITIGTSFVTAAYGYGNSAGTIFGGIIEGIIICAIGILISWISVLTLYGFGVMVENSDELVRLNGGIPSGNKKAAKIEVPKHMQERYQAPVPQPAQPVISEQPAEEVKPAEPVSSTKTCPNCGETVSEEAHFCKNCGTKLDD